MLRKSRVITELSCIYWKNLCINGPTPLKYSLHSCLFINDPMVFKGQL